MTKCSRCPDPAHLTDSYCRPCRAEIQREYRERHRDRLKQAGELERAARKLALADLRGGACADCGEPYTTETGRGFDLHHRDPAGKSFGFGGGLTRDFGALASEAEQCDLLCGLCHRLRHSDAGTQSWYSRNLPWIRARADEHLASLNL